MRFSVSAISAILLISSAFGAAVPVKRCKPHEQNHHGHHHHGSGYGNGNHSSSAPLSTKVLTEPSATLTLIPPQPPSQSITVDPTPPQPTSSESLTVDPVSSHSTPPASLTTQPTPTQSVSPTASVTANPAPTNPVTTQSRPAPQSVTTETKPTQPATTQPTTTAPAPISTPQPPANRASKRGISYNNVALTKDFDDKISWAYDWSSAPSGDLPNGIDFFPMLWSGSPDHTSAWMANAKKAIASGSTHLLFLNEPDLSSQANTDPTTAAKLWMQYMQPFAGQATLVSPAITNGGAPMGTAWMDSFLAECDKLGCQVDAIAAHIYDMPSNVGYYKNYITDLGTRYKRPVLMTEIGVSGGSVDDQKALIQELVPFLDNLDSVSHYAWFMAGPGFLVNNDGSLNVLGQAYQSA